MSLDKPPMSPYGEYLGIDIVDYQQGRASCRLDLKAHHFNNGGRVHGGVLTSLADTTAGAAVRSVRPQGKFSATTDLSIAFIRPPRGDWLLAEAQVIHAGRQLLRCEISIYCEDKLVARSSCTFMIIESARTE